ncbi:hypothetical protein pb186bvf_018356 [Paramecium bursaria]
MKILKKFSIITIFLSFHFYFYQIIFFKQMIPVASFPPLFQINREAIIEQVPEVVVVEQEQEQPEVIVPEDVELLPQNQTLYVNRLNEKIQIEDMRQTLYALFSQYGSVIDVVTKKNIKMRGQAFVIMESLEEAQMAQQQLNNYQLYDKVMKVNFAKEKSDYISKKEGTYIERDKLPMSDKIKEHKKRIQERQQKQQLNQRQQKEVPTISIPLGFRETKPKFGNQPNKTLFVEGLLQVDFGNLEQHFRNFYGFREFRGIKPKAVAFVEFEDELKATHCLNELNGTEFEGVNLQISYQKK